MIKFLIQLAEEGCIDEYVDDALPLLKKYGLADEQYEVDEEEESEDKARALVEHVSEHAEDKLLVFDMECIENDDDYGALTRMILKYAGEEESAQDITSEFDHEEETAGVSLRVGDATIEASWSQRGDWVAREFMDFIEGMLREQFSKSILIFPAEDQCCRLAIVEADEHEKIDPLFRYMERGVPSSDLYLGQLVSTVIVAVLGFTVTFGAGWFFFSLWIGLLGSLALWGAFAAFYIVKFSLAAAAEEELQELQQENPEEYGKMMAEALMEEVAARRRSKDS